MTGVLRRLGDDLVLRRGSSADTDRIVEFCREVFRREDGSEDEGVVLWARDLMEHPPPGFAPDLFTVVEDTAGGALASMLCLIPQTWAYSGVPFGVGRIELVGTRPAYRGRGLIGVQMDVVHRWSEEMGHLAQAITGIPWYYRRFGYDMAIDLGGGRSGSLEGLPEAGDGDRWRVRAATGDDAALLAGLYDAAMERYLVTCRRPEEVWSYELFGRSPGAAYRRSLFVIEREGTPAGMLVVSGPEDGTIWVTLCEVIPERGWREGTLAALRHLRTMAVEAGGGGGRVRFTNMTDHPAFAAVPDVLERVHDPYAWYVRVADLAAFLRRMAPVLEWNLAESPFAGVSESLRINLYAGGLLIRLDDGALSDVGHFTPAHPEDGDAAFPDQTILQLLFGRRSAAELGAARADCWFSGDVTVNLLDSLFRPGSSLVYAIG